MWGSHAQLTFLWLIILERDKLLLKKTANFASYYQDGGEGDFSVFYNPRFHSFTSARERFTILFEIIEYQLKDGSAIKQSYLICVAFAEL